MKNTILLVSFLQEAWIDSLEKLILTIRFFRADGSCPKSIFHSPSFCARSGRAFIALEKEAVYLDIRRKNVDNSHFYFQTALDSNNLQILSGISGKLL